MHRKTVLTAVLLLGAAALGTFLWFRITRAPEARLLRLLPAGADLYAVADLNSLQTNPAIRKLLSDPPPMSLDQDYKRFVEGTGFQYQRDLKAMAVAKVGSEWVGTAEISGNHDRLVSYLKAQAVAKLTEQGQTVFTFGVSRPLRVALLDAELVAFSVGQDDNLIRQVLQRQAGDASSSAAAELERGGDLRRVPKHSSVWMIGRAERLFGKPESAARLGDFALGDSVLRGSKMLYVGIRSGLTQVEFHIEDLCQDTAAAERLAQTLQGMLALAKAIPSDSSSGSDDNLTALLADISIEQVEDSVVARWRWDAETLRRFQATSPQESKSTVP